MRKIIGNVVFLAFLVAMFLVAGPTQLGGPASYVIVSGTSMEPTYLDGDLVIARHHDTYAVGDVITYQVPTDVTVQVIHRITEITDAGYITQGDNRDEVDNWVVARDAVYGSSWLHLPKGGIVVMFLRQPATLLAIVAAVAVYLVLARRERRQLEERLHAAADVQATDTAPTEPGMTSAIRTRPLAMQDGRTTVTTDRQAAGQTTGEAEAPTGQRRSTTLLFVAVVVLAGVAGVVVTLMANA